ncbi:MAG: type II toxin-antitoxin system VapC family toxin [Carbonactinosporaceae bacterium]
MIYVDSSALVKLVLSERESAALEHWIDERADVPHVSSELVQVEVPRAVMRAAPVALLHAREVLDRVGGVSLSPRILETAATLQPPALRSLDAVHLASALLLRRDLTAFVAYDDRLLAAAKALGLPVEQPT